MADPHDCIMFMYPTRKPRIVHEICSDDGDIGPKKCHRHTQQADKSTATAMCAMRAPAKSSTASVNFAASNPAPISRSITTAMMEQAIDTRPLIAQQTQEPQLIPETIRDGSFHLTTVSDFATQTSKKSSAGHTIPQNAANVSSINTSNRTFTRFVPCPGMRP